MMWDSEVRQGGDLGCRLLTSNHLSGSWLISGRQGAPVDKGARRSERRVRAARSTICCGAEGIRGGNYQCFLIFIYIILYIKYI